MLDKTLGHYRILEKIGAGGMGEVYRAEDLHLRRDVAIKVLPAGTLADEQARRRFRKEAEALSRLNHPNIQTVFDFDTQQETDFLVVEFVSGPTLAEKLGAGALPEKEIAALGVQIAAALEEAHGQGVVHRDLKPGNIKVTPKGQVKVLDFGVAELLKPAAASTTTQSFAAAPAAAGTLPYMAPEQLRGEALDHRSDLWGAGAILYEMAAGRRPFEAKLATALAADIQTKPVTPPAKINPEVSARLEEIILKCLEKDPENRYQSAKELLVDLRRLTTHTHILAPSVQRSGIRRWISQPGGFAAVAAALAVLLAVSLALNVGSVRERLSGIFQGDRPRIDSLAVLPLKNLMGDPQQDYFVEGMHEALTTELSKISALKVISRTSTMRYKGTDKPLPQVARELNVDAVVEGSVLREGDQVRVTVQLIHAPSDRHLWAENYQRELRGILALYSEVARAIAGEIRVKLTPQEQTRLASHHAVNPAAYDLYILGRHYWNQRTMHGHTQAVETFRKALEQDPGYAPAYAALADAYMMLGEQGGLPQREAGSLAEAAIQRALKLEEGVAEAHSALGVWKLHYEWNWAGAERAFQRAIELNPGDALAHGRYGRFLAFLGRFEEAILQAQRARELDPLSVLTNAYTGQVYLYARQYDRAAEQFRQTLELNPNHPLGLHNLGELHLAQGRFAEAIPPLESSMQLSGQFSGLPSSHFLAMLGCAYARASRREDAVKILSELERRLQQGLVSAFDIASLQTALGEKERAFAWLEQGYQQRDIWLVELKAWPWFDSLHGDPRFRDLLRRMNFPE